MKIRTLIIVGLFSAAQAATAALTPGTGGGYYGSAWYDSGQGSVVGPYPTYQQCQVALQNALDNAVNNFGWNIVSVDYCHYNPPAPMIPHELSPAESLDYVSGIMDDIKTLRALYRPEAFEKALCDITDPDEDEDFDCDEQDR